MSNTQIPGFTPEQSWVIRTVVRETAREVVAELSAGKSCPFYCKDMEELRTTVYGNGNPGLKSSVVTLKEQVSTLIWWNRATVVAALGAIGSVIMSLIY